MHHRWIREMGSFSHQKIWRNMSTGKMNFDHNLVVCITKQNNKSENEMRRNWGEFLSVWGMEKYLLNVNTEEDIKQNNSQSKHMKI